MASVFLFVCTCFICRKKLSNFHHSGNWLRAHNYVAKAYIEPVDSRVYFDDVKLQNDAKLWGEEYNRHNPPKKVRQKSLNLVYL